jgi:fructokinase
MTANVPVIVGLGEALFDLFPDGARLGGAPLNLAVHAHLLGNCGVVVSRVGPDDYAQCVLDELRRRGMPVDHIQVDSTRPTGTVRVDVDPHGEPTFTITNDVAWDYLEFDAPGEDLARRCNAVCFGTLAQRNPQSRSAIHRFLESAGQAMRLFDVNLRQQYFDRPTLRRSCELATAMKLNRAEVDVVGEMLGVGTGQEKVSGVLLERFDLDWVAVTRGAAGVAIYADGRMHEADPVPATPGGDAVGAGDAAGAALLHGAVRHWPWARTARLANTLGAHVASQAGACPPHTLQIAEMAR